MQITLQQSNQLKALAILMMLCLHLFNRDHVGLFEPLIFVGDKPLSYYLSLFSDACVPIFAFVSGYGLYYKFLKNKETYKADNFIRVKKLYINYWIILLLFAVGLGWFLAKDGYPGSVQKFVLNFTGINPTYNGAWWFFTTYVLFVLTSSFWFKLMSKIPLLLYIGVLLIVYVIAFYFRIYKPNLFASDILNYFQTQLALYFCTLFQFMLGAFILQWKVKESILSRIKQFRYKNIFGLILIIGLIILHGIIPNFIIAPFTGLAFILIFIQLQLPNFFNKILDFFTPHATNMWLIHMFFYMIYFPEFIYGFQYPILIFGVLVALCILSSYIVNMINKKINQWV